MIRRQPEVSYEWRMNSGYIRRVDATGRDILKSDLIAKPEIPHKSKLQTAHEKHLKGNK